MDAVDGTLHFRIEVLDAEAEPVETQLAQHRVFEIPIPVSFPASLSHPSDSHRSGHNDVDWREITLGAGSGAGSGSPAGAMLVEIRPEGLRLGGRPAGIDDIGRQVRARLATHPDQRVLVRPAPGVEIQRTVDVLDALRAAGAPALVLAR